MSKESKHPSRRDFGKTALALLLGSQAAGAASNPYHDKARGEQRKLAKSLKYSRDVEDLKKLTQDAYFDKDFPLKHMIIDVSVPKRPAAQYISLLYGGPETISQGNVAESTEVTKN